MKKTTQTPPVIIIGMHRSGTSMITKFLGKAGLFIGKDIDVHAESNFFYRANEWVLRLSGGAWDNPTPVHTLLENNEVRGLVEKHLQRYVSSFRVINFLGLTHYLKQGSPSSMDIPWGWKDPRNSFTLPLWLTLFPEAKIIHIYRHGIDVAQSLCMRQQKGITSLRKNINLKRRLKYFFSPLPSYFLRSIHLTSVNEGVKLWETYLAEEYNHLAKEKNEVLQIKYEDFLEKPDENLCQLIKFCGLSCDEKNLSDLVAKVNASRAFAYKESELLREIASNNSALLKTYGYP